MKNIDHMLETMVQVPPGPHAHIDETLVPRLKELIGKSAAEQATGMKVILDEAAHAALASDFGMMVMDQAWELAKAHADET